MAEEESSIIGQVTDLLQELDEREYPVTLPLADALNLEDFLLINYGITEYPDIHSAFRALYGQVIDTVDKIKESTSKLTKQRIVSVFDERPTTITFRQSDMDFINMVFENKINACRLNKEEFDQASNLRILTDSVKFMGEVNRAFIASGALISPLYSQYFEGEAFGIAA